MQPRLWTRREILKAGGAAVALPTLLPTTALGHPGRPGVHDQVKVAIIGLGGRARGVVEDCRELPGLRIVAVADCFAPRVGAFIKDQARGESWKGYDDFREMIEVEKPDGVMVETTTHARAWITVHAMQLGCDTYIEKPMALSIPEGRYLVRAARKYGRVAQVGTQQRSMEVNNWASDLVRGGALGKVHTVIAPNFVGPKRWIDLPQDPLPEGVAGDWWNIWSNQAVMRPYHSKLHFGWTAWGDYDGGGECFGVTGWGAHSYDQVNRALGTDDTGPVEVLLEEEVRESSTGKFTNPRGSQDTGADFHAMARPVVGPRAKVSMRFASGARLDCHLDGDVGPGLGAIFVGENGRVEINRGQVASDPVELTVVPGRPLAEPERGTRAHVRDWLRCVRSRERPTADIESGQRSSTLCHLVNIVRDAGRVGEALRWDPVHERFEDCDAANRLLDRPRRKGWELPDLG